MRVLRRLRPDRRGWCGKLLLPVADPRRVFAGSERREGMLVEEVRAARAEIADAGSRLEAQIACAVCCTTSRCGRRICARWRKCSRSSSPALRSRTRTMCGWDTPSSGRWHWERTWSRSVSLYRSRCSASIASSTRPGARANSLVRWLVRMRWRSSPMRPRSVTSTTVRSSRLQRSPGAWRSHRSDGHRGAGQAGKHRVCAAELHDAARNDGGAGTALPNHAPSPSMRSSGSERDPG